VQTLTHCLVCRAPSDGSPVIHRRAAGDQLVRCRRCGLLYSNPQWTPDELVALYRDEYYDEHTNLATDFRARDYELTRPLHELGVRDLLRRYPRLRPRAGRPVRVLDYGSGVGYFLVACKRAGLDPLGLDFADVAARVARERFDVEVRSDPDGELARLPSERFDLVTAWQVLEHLRDPRETMQQLVRVLAPGGVFAAAVPNLGALAYRLRGGRWFNVVNPTHLTFFDRATLTRLYRDAGLTRITRPLLWGGSSRRRLARDLAQFAIRCANLGNELRLYAEKPR
jgi:2-polyprenyl-3-methyl-5-hydroxy-6-metoxy-1,4-benzoquinol methylase